MTAEVVDRGRVLVELENVADALLDARFVLDFLMGSITNDDMTYASVVDIKVKVVQTMTHLEGLVARLKQADAAQ